MAGLLRKPVRRILLAGTGSGSGKTTLTCGLLRCLIRRGIIPSAFKCGPDYIDPMFHQKVLGVPSGNLDGFFCDGNTLNYLLAEHTPENSIAVIEGVMGYYDGVGMTSEASSAELAAQTDTPAVLLVGCRGMAASVRALVKGYVDYEAELAGMGSAGGSGGEAGRGQLRGVIFNMLPESLYAEAADYVRQLGLLPLGYVPQHKELKLESRHLGLKTPEEIGGFQERVDQIADILEQTVDIEGILSLAAQAPELVYENVWEDAERPEKPLRVAVARDEAFCFLYRDNLEFLERAGCELEYFSPLKDTGLPGGCDLLLLCGGYPELYADRLSQNTAMRAAVREWLQSGRPYLAECGGFLYLQEELEDMRGVLRPMAGAFSGRGLRNRRLQGFGYIRLEAQRDGLLGRQGAVWRAHEFHYWSCEQNGTDFLAVKPSNGRSWPTAFSGRNSYAGFPHLYFYGNREEMLRLLRELRQDKISVT